jgi:hypothetical protein
MCRIYLALLLGIALAGMGCGRSKTYTGADGEKVTVTKSGDNAEITFTGKDGEKMQMTSSAKGGSLPKNFPKDAPIYPGAAVTISSNAKDGMMVMLKTSDSLEKVKEFYEKALKEQGWDNENSVNMGQNMMLANKKDNRQLTVQIMSGDETVIQIVLTEEKDK